MTEVAPAAPESSAGPIHPVALRLDHSGGMAAPVGITRDQVVDAAVAVLEQKGRVDAVALREVAARLGLRTQSLYAHVKGVDGLRHALALRAHEALAAHLASAAAGKTGADAVEAIVRAYYAFAVERPGLYDASLRPPGDDPEMLAATEAVTRPLNAVFESYGLDRAATVHWYRIVFAGVHGFAILQRDGLLTYPGDPQESLGRMIQAFVHQLEAEVSAAR
jgi:AcrR family transcriptional regulator